MRNYTVDESLRSNRQARAVHKKSLSILERGGPFIMRTLSYATQPDQTSGMYRYGAIPKSESELNNKINYYLEKDVTRESTKRKKWWLAVMVIGTFFVVLSALSYESTTSNDDLVDEPCLTIDHGYQCSPNVSRYWGQYSPFFSVQSDISADVPEQCQITFAQILSRHGARDPTLHRTQIYHKLIDDIQSNATAYSDQFAFIKDFNYTLGADMLSVFGQKQMVDSGIRFFDRYRTISREITPFIRASGQSRVIESAQNWTQGFHKARMQDSDSNVREEYPYNILIISEETGSNNTLDHGLCQKFENAPISEIGPNAKSIWASIFTPSIAARLNSNMPGVNFTGENVIDLMSICPFETVTNEFGLMSPFCNLFSEDEWHAYDYYQTLGKYYEYSWGNPLGPTQGVGFTNELIARMTSKPVIDHTCTNSTLDNNPETFPISNSTVLYADFTHDNTMISIFSAMGLYNSTPPLSNTTLESAEVLKGFSTSWMTSFGSRTYFEKMKCHGINEEMVRIIVNDRVVPLEACKPDASGRCKLSDFVDSLTFAKNGGNWDKC